MRGKRRRAECRYLTDAPELQTRGVGKAVVSMRADRRGLEGG